MRDRLPRSGPLKNECGIVNLDSSTGSGTHWVAYYKKGNVIDYFDSFGNLQPPIELINYLGERINYNYFQYQKFNSINCGHLCLSFLFDKCNYKINK